MHLQVSMNNTYISFLGSLAKMLAVGSTVFTGVLFMYRSVQIVLPIVIMTMTLMLDSIARCYHDYNLNVS